MNQTKLNGWREDLESLKDEVYYMLDNRKTFKRLVEEHNKQEFNITNLQDPHWIFDRSNYAGNMTMCIGRQVDNKRNVISLRRLIEDILRNASLFDKDWFLSEHPEASGETLFKELFSSVDKLNTEKLKIDLDQILNTTRSVVDHRHNRIGHRSRNQFIPSEPTFNDIDKSVTLIHDLYIRLYYLLQQRGLSFSLD